MTKYSDALLGNAMDSNILMCIMCFPYKKYLGRKLMMKDPASRCQCLNDRFLSEEEAMVYVFECGFPRLLAK